MAGGVIAGIVALAIWLSQFLGGFGLGLGSGGLGTGKSDDESSPKNGIGKQPSKVVEIHFDKDKRPLLKKRDGGRTTYEPVTVGQIVALSENVAGDDHGVKVLIIESVKSGAGEGEKLKTELVQAGMMRPSINVRKPFAE